MEADEVCAAIETGIKMAYPDAVVKAIPLADGGEGTMQILTGLANGNKETAIVQDPLGRKIEAEYGIAADGQTAFIEMAAASGLKLLDKHEYNPAATSTFGTGQLILKVVERGVENVILGIGGSATNDAGIGMAAALGYRFFDQNDQLLSPIGGNLQHIARIDASQVLSELKEVRFTIACDVTNPLYGREGAAYVYGPQKGADATLVETLDQGLKHFSKIATKTFGKDISQTPGAGAAGGLGAGCIYFLNATLQNGVGIVMEQAGIENIIADSDLVITGEGKVDEQTLSGKVVKGLADRCSKYKVPLAVVCGTLLISPEQTRSAGITYAVSVLNKPMDLDEALLSASKLVKEATFNMVRLFFQK